MKKIFGLFLVAFMAMGMCFADPVEGCLASDEFNIGNNMGCYNNYFVKCNT